MHRQFMENYSNPDCGIVENAVITGVSFAINQTVTDSFGCIIK